MADIIDNVNRELERSYQRGVSNCISQFSKPSEEACIDCGDEIPQARQKLGGVERCVYCQTDYERK